MQTPQQITERLRQAARAVQQAELSDDLRSIGFERALDALGLGSGAGAPAAASVPPLSHFPGPGAAANDGESSGGLLAAIARRFELSVDKVERIYDTAGGTVRLAIKRSMLPNADRKAAAMRNVSLLVAAGRQASGAEDHTTISVMRDECDALNVLDGANFSSEIAKLDFRITGGRNSRTAKANRHHFDDAAQLVRRILGESES